VRPALATTGGPLIVISTPHGRHGAVWDTYSRHYGPDGDPSIVVAQAPSRAMNPTLPQRVVDRAIDADPDAARAEYLAEFRSDLERVFTVESIAAVTSPGVAERPPAPGVVYRAFTDPSGGSADGFTVAIAHRDGDTVVIDAIRERRPPFSPEDVARDFASLLRDYRVHTVVGDRYSGEWVREAFLRHGITYKPAAKSKSELYAALVAATNAGRIDLLDVPRLASQLVSLERRVARGGRESIDHPPRGHDDLANAVAGVLVEAGRPRRKITHAAPILITGHPHRDTYRLSGDTL